MYKSYQVRLLDVSKRYLELCKAYMQKERERKANREAKQNKHNLCHLKM